MIWLVIISFADSYSSSKIFVHENLDDPAVAFLRLGFMH